MSELLAPISKEMITIGYNLSFDKVPVEGKEDELHTFFLIRFDEGYGEVAKIRTEKGSAIFECDIFDANKGEYIRGDKTVDLIDTDEELKAIGHSVALNRNMIALTEDAVETERVFYLDGTASEKEIILMKTLILEIKVRQLLKDFYGDAIIVHKLIKD